MNIVSFLRLGIYRDLILLEDRFPCVLYMTNLGHTQSLFLGLKYEKYFGRPSIDLIKDLTKFKELIIENDSDTNASQVFNHLVSRNSKKNYETTGVFQFQNPETKKVYNAVDRLFTFSMEGLEECINCGVCFPVEKELWECTKNQKKIFSDIEKVLIEYHQILIKNSPISTNPKDRPNDAIKILSKREIETLRGILYGKTAKMIAEELGLSKRTVEYYTEKIKDKLGLMSRIEVIIWAIENHVVDIKI